MIELLLLLAGAALGVGADRGWDFYLERHRLQQLRKYRIATSPRMVRQKLLSTYGALGTTDHLLKVPGMPHGEHVIPFVVDPRWEFVSDVTEVPDDRVILGQPSTPDPVRELQDHEDPDVNIFDAPALRFHRVQYNDEGTSVVLSQCRYASLASRMRQVEKELATQSAKKLARKSTFKSSLSDADRASSRQNFPAAAGAAAAIVLTNSSGQQEVLLHRRSGATIASRGTLAVVPTFGLSPYPKLMAEDQFGILYFNFIRECLEELFDFPETDIDGRRVQLERRLDRIPEAQILRAGIARFQLLGFGFNSSHGGLVFALACFLSPEASERLREGLSGNWEIGDASGDRFQVIPFTRSSLVDALRRDDINFSSAFTLRRMLDEYLSQ